MEIKSGRVRPYLFTLPSLLFILIFLLFSLLYVIIYTPNFLLTFIELIIKEEFFSVFSRTIRVGLIVAFGATVLAYPLTYYVNFSSPSIKSFFKIIVFLPLMVNPIVRSYGWIIILGKEGVINTLLYSIKIIGEPLRLLYTEFAMELGLLELFFPFMFIPLLSAMENLGNEVIMAARSLGAGSLRIFFNIVFPLTLKGYLVGLTVILAGCASAYVTPTLLGGFRNRTLSMLLYEFIEVRFDWASATATALVILLTVIGVNLLFNRVGNYLVKR
ncbi:MAG: ABC transporter permease [Nitrososphaeria archaeon]